MGDSEGTRKLEVILAADVAGYSRLMGDDEAATVRTLTEYGQVFSGHIGRHGGRIVDTAGDSVLALCDSAVEAVECAIEIHHLTAPARSRKVVIPSGPSRFATRLCWQSPERSKEQAHGGKTIRAQVYENQRPYGCAAGADPA